MTSITLYIIAGIFVLIAILIAILARVQFEKEIRNCRITAIISFCVLIFAIMSIFHGTDLMINEKISMKIENKICETYIGAELIDINVNKNTYDGYFIVSGNTYKFKGKNKTMEISDINNSEETQILQIK